MPEASANQPKIIPERERVRFPKVRKWVRDHLPRRQSSTTPPSQDVTHETHLALAELQQTLVTESHAALGEPTFTQRNDRMAAVVVSVSTPLTVASIGKPEAGSMLEPVFLQAAKEEKHLDLLLLKMARRL